MLLRAGLQRRSPPGILLRHLLAALHLCNEMSSQGVGVRLELALSG
jgi:hypothetical protein